MAGCNAHNVHFRWKAHPSCSRVMLGQCPLGTSRLCFPCPAEASSVPPDPCPRLQVQLTLIELPRYKVPITSKVTVSTANVSLPVEGRIKSEIEKAVGKILLQEFVAPASMLLPLAVEFLDSAEAQQREAELPTKVSAMPWAMRSHAPAPWPHVRVCARARVGACVCMHDCARICMSVCVCVCVPTGGTEGGRAVDGIVQTGHGRCPL